MGKVQVEVPYAFGAVVIPRGERVPCPIVFKGSKVIELDSVAANDAPLAFRWDSSLDGGTKFVRRYYANRLWEPLSGGKARVPVSFPKMVDNVRQGATYINPLQIAVGCPGHVLKYYPNGEICTARPSDDDFVTDYNRVVSSNEDAALHKLNMKAQNVIVIDGMAWVASDEPVYVTTTFGLARSNGGTALFIKGLSECHTVKSNIFRADHYREAVAHSELVARRRGDTMSMPIKCNNGLIEVLLPEAIRMKPAVPERIRCSRSLDAPGL